MPITLLDIILLVVMLISGLLAMIRGFMREILSIAAWAAAAVATLYFYHAAAAVREATISTTISWPPAAVIGGMFLGTLLIVSIITVRISDMILDSRVGALDRTLGFLFGLGRGLIIVVVAFLFFDWLVPQKSQPAWVSSAKSRVVLQGTGDWLKSMLPDDPESTILKRLKRPKEDDGEADAPPGQRSENGAARETHDGYERSDRDRYAAVDRRQSGNRRVDPPTEARWTADEPPVHPIKPPTATPPTISISTATGCARNAACSASSAIPTPPPSPRSACTRSSIAARKPPASSPSTASASIPSAGSASSATTSPSAEVIDRLPGMRAVGHVRYSTTGETILRNVQPLFAELDAGGFAIGHNGNLTNGLTLRRQLVRDGAIMQSTTDTEVILHLVARSKKPRFVDRFIDGLRALEGAYSFVGADQQEADRRPRSARHPPAGARRARRRPILASETCALDIIGAKYVRDIENGEVVVFDEEGMHIHKPFPPMAPRPCIFEYIYFSRPDSIVGGRSVYDVRKTHGRASSRAKRRPMPTSSCRCRIPACRPRSAMRRRPASPSSSASSATTMSAAPSSSRRSRSASSACG